MDNQAHNISDEDEGAFEFALGDELRGERATLGKTLLDVQRDLRIQATYIAAIEDGNVDAFPNKSFIPGYIRSYSRYLSLDPDVVYRRFCEENNVQPAKGSFGGTATKDKKAVKNGAISLKNDDTSFQPKFPLHETKSSAFASIDFAAIGSLAVVCTLVAGLGYGGWSVLQNIQRVQFAPVEDLPIAVAEVAPLDAPNFTEQSDATFAELASPVTSASLSDLYRQQELEVPIIAPRDGPIAAINPDRMAPLEPQQVDRLLAEAAARQITSAAKDIRTEQISVSSAVAMTTGDEIDLVEAAETVAAISRTTEVAIVAERAAWVRVYLKNGTVIFEQILEKGESYTPPAGIDMPHVWAGNSGSVYVRLGDELRGPLGRGTRAVRDVALDPISIASSYDVVTDVPEILTQSFGPATGNATDAFTFR